MNMDRTGVDQLMGEIGQLDDAVSEVVRDTDDRWIVRIDDIDVQVVFDEPAQCLRLGTEIGVPTPAKREALYEQLLIYNVAGHETGDVVMALTGPNGSVMQLLKIPTESVTARDLVTPIVNLSARTAFWRALVLSGVEPIATAAESDSVPEFFIRA